MITTALRVKRKRTDDPVSALYFDDTRSAEHRKKIRVDNVVYRLSQTLDNPNDVKPSTVSEPAVSIISPLPANAASTKSFLTKDLVLESSAAAGQVATENNRVFRLARPSDGFNTVAPQSQQERVVISPPQQQQPQEQLPPELASMLDSYLEKNIPNAGFQSNAPHHILPSVHGKFPQPAQPNQVPSQPHTTLANQPLNLDRPDTEAEDYVYDIYYSHQIPGNQGGQTLVPRAPQANGNGLIGFIKFDSEDEKLLGVADEDDDSDAFGSEDEDSNAEDYYKNDYPDEESGNEDSDIDITAGPKSGYGFAAGEDNDDDDLDELADDEDEDEYAQRRGGGGTGSTRLRKRYSYSDLYHNNYDEEDDEDYDGNFVHLDTEEEDDEFLDGLNESDYDLRIDDNGYDGHDNEMDGEAIGRVQPSRRIRANDPYLQSHEAAIAGFQGLKLAHEDEEDESDDAVSRALDEALDQDAGKEEEEEEEEKREDDDDGPRAGEGMTEYRDRIFGQLQKEIDRRNAEKKG